MIKYIGTALATSLFLAGCASAPPVPDASSATTLGVGHVSVEVHNQKNRIRNMNGVSTKGLTLYFSESGVEHKVSADKNGLFYYPAQKNSEVHLSKIAFRKYGSRRSHATIDFNVDRDLKTSSASVTDWGHLTLVSDDMTFDMKRGHDKPSTRALYSEAFPNDPWLNEKWQAE